MSSRTTLRPHLVITSGDMSADITSEPTILQSISCASYALSWSGTSPVGTAAVEFSNDYSLNPDGSVNNSGTWTTAELSVGGAVVTSVAVTGNTGTIFIDLEKTAAYAVRLFYDKTSGVGSLNATINGKVS